MMSSLTWIDGLRVLALAGMSYGVWQGLKKLPPTLRYNGEKYYALPDGRFSTAWGRIVKDQALMDALKVEAAR